MGYIAETKWHKKDINTKWLFANGFRFNKEYSDKDSDVYTYLFPVYKYNKIPLYECMIIIYCDNGEVNMRVQDCKTKSLYPQFYYDSQNNHTCLINKIERVILNELKKLEIEPIQPKRKKRTK